MNFALIGAAGFIAPRHLQAMHALGHDLVAAFDPSDSVGILDRYFPECRFFTKFEQFQAYLEEQKTTPNEVSYVSICSPNDLHSAHIKFALRLGAHAICEKPLVLTIRELEDLASYERKTDRRVFTVLQLRHHKKIQELKLKVDLEKKSQPYAVNLTYMTSRGAWYHESWKGDIRRSGGLSSNIGIHFFDMLTWIFGDCVKAELIERTTMREKGFLQLKNANVNWSLSVDRKDLPVSAVESGKSTFRSITIDGEEFEFSDGFTELHSEVYKSVIAGNGFGLQATAQAIRIVEELRRDV